MLFREGSRRMKYTVSAEMVAEMQRTRVAAWCRRWWLLRLIGYPLLALATVLGYFGAMASVISAGYIVFQVSLALGGPEGPGFVVAVIIYFGLVVALLLIALRRFKLLLDRSVLSAELVAVIAGLVLLLMVVALEVFYQARP
jgi:hypothetical protein